jgi:hypothetical protein
VSRETRGRSERSEADLMETSMVNGERTDDL